MVLNFPMWSGKEKALSNNDAEYIAVVVADVEKGISDIKLTVGTMATAF